MVVMGRKKDVFRPGLGSICTQNAKLRQGPVRYPIPQAIFRTAQNIFSPWSYFCNHYHLEVLSTSIDSGIISDQLGNWVGMFAGLDHVDDVEVFVLRLSCDNTITYLRRAGEMTPYRYVLRDSERHRDC